MTTLTKKTLTSIGIVGAVIIAALLIYAILVTPAKQPYRDALAQYKNVYNSNVQLTALGSSLGASTATDEQFTKNINAAKEGIRVLGVENQALGKEAVLQSGEGKMLYDSFNAKLADYLKYNSTVLDSVQQVRPVLFACSKNMSSVTPDSSGVEAMRSCATKFEGLSTVGDADYKAYVQIAQTRYAALADNLQATAELADPKGADASRAQELSSELEAIIADMNADGSALAKGLAKSKQAVDITATAMALDEYLQKKSNIF